MFNVSSFFIFNAGAYYIIERRETRETLEGYTNQNVPDHAVMLLNGSRAGRSSKVILGSINISKDL